MKPVTVTLLAFNDFHRRLQPFADGSGGAERLVGKLRQLQEQLPHSLTVNLGDVAGDNVAPGPDAFEPIADLFNRARVDVLALGNHEFEDPQGNYQSLREGLIEPFQGEVLCANVRQASNGQPLEGTRPYTIRQLAGFNIALIGVVTRDLSSKMFPAAGAGLAVAPIETTLQELADELESRADATVVLGHESLREMKQHTLATPGVDVTLAAHDHRLDSQKLVRDDGSTASLSEAGAYGQSINQIDLIFDPQSRQLLDVVVTHHAVDSDAPQDEVAAEIVRQAPNLEKATRPEPTRKKEIRLDRLSDLGQWFQVHQSRTGSTS